MTVRPGIPAHMRKPYDLEDVIDAYNEGVQAMYSALRMAGKIDLAALDAAFRNKEIPALETFRAPPKSEKWQ